MSHFSVVLRAYADAWARRRIFVPLYLTLRLLAFAIIAPGVAIAVNLAVSFSDQSALTDQDIAFFILSPVGFLVTLTVLSLALVAEIVSFSVMAATLRVDTEDSWRAGAVGFATVISKVRDLFEFAGRLILRVLVIAAPFIAVAGFVAWWTLTEYDINYYLTFKPPAFVVAGVLIGAVLLVMAWVLIRRLSGWALTLHLVLFENTRPKHAFGESAKLMQGRRGSLKIRLVVWLVARLAIGAVLAGLAGLAVQVIPVPDGGGLGVALRASVAILLLWSLAGLVLAAVALGALAVILDGYQERPITLHPKSTSTGMRRKLALALGAAGVALIVGGWVGNQVLDRVQTDDFVEVIAHRGAAGSRPENTMASVQKALDDGADWVEIDVQETADGVVVVMHDSDYMKLAGVNLKIWDATMDDLDQIDIGSWFDPAYADERTPTLRDVLAAARGKSKVLIELKYYGHDEDLENRVAEIVEDLGMEDQIATMSLKYPAVQKMRKLRPDWRTGVLAATAVGDLAGLEGDFIAVNSGMVSPGLIRSVHGAGKDIYAWTVNDPLEMSGMISKGVDGLITDEPALVRQVLAVRATLNPAERFMLWLTEEMGLDLTPGDYRDSSP